MARTAESKIMHRGYVKLYRKITDSFFYRDSEAVHLWVHILIKANHSNAEFMFNGKRVKLERGQFVTGRKTLSQETGINESKIFRLLKTFKSEHLIEQQTSSKNSIITVVNYDYHQESEHLIEQQMNSKRTASEQQVNTNKNNNTLKNEKELKENTCPLFGKAWELYDLKKDRKKAETAWKKLNKSQKEKALEAIPVYVATTGRDKKFRKLFTTWINGECWNDEHEVKESTSEIYNF